MNTKALLIIVGCIIFTAGFVGFILPIFTYADATFDRIFGFVPDLVGVYPDFAAALYLVACSAFLVTGLFVCLAGFGSSYLARKNQGRKEV